MKTSVNHIALQYSDRKKAEIFFTDILGIPKIRSFTLSDQLSEKVFGIEKTIDVDVFDNESVRFEIFITDQKNKPSFVHTCIEIDNKEEFIKICNKNGLDPYIVPKGDKELLFVKDFSDNLYEVKEK